MEIGRDIPRHNANNSDIKKPQLKTHRFGDKVDARFGESVDSCVEPLSYAMNEQFKELGDKPVHGKYTNPAPEPIFTTHPFS